MCVFDPSVWQKLCQRSPGGDTETDSEYAECILKVLIRSILQRLLQLVKNINMGSCQCPCTRIYTISYSSIYVCLNRGQCEEAYSKASQMLGLINRTVVLEGSRVMEWWLVLLVNYAVIGNGSNMRWS